MTGRVPVTELLRVLQAGRSLLGVAVTPASIEVAVLPAPYLTATLLRTGRFLSPEELVGTLRAAEAHAVVLGGSAAFRTDGSTQLGVRKLISGLRGLVYDSDWLPTATPQPHGSRGLAAAAPGGPDGAGAGVGSGGSDVKAPQAVPIWLCRKGQDDAARMVAEHVREHMTPQQRLLLWSSGPPADA